MSVTFKELERARDRIAEIQSIDTGADPKFTDSLEKWHQILDDAVTNGVDSTYFDYVSPFSITISNRSQARAISKDPALVKSLEDSIARIGVREPILASSSRDGDQKEVLNGVNRTAAAKNLKKTKDHKDLMLPAIVIPYSEHGDLEPALPAVQAILNEHMPCKTNNTNDVQKTMAGLVETLDLDIVEGGKKSADYRKLVSYASIIFAHKSQKAILNNATRLMNKMAANRSDVTCGSPGEFLEHFREAFGATHPDVNKDLYNVKIGNALFKKASLVFMSTKGSTADQLLFRSAIDKLKDPNTPIICVFADQDNGGDSQTTIRSRETILKKVYLSGDVFKDGVPFDVIAIAPQNRNSFLARLENNTVVETEPENIEQVQDWIIISKKEYKDYYEKVKVKEENLGTYKKEWVVREKRRHLQLVSSEA